MIKTTSIVMKREAAMVDSIEPVSVKLSWSQKNGIAFKMWEHDRNNGHNLPPWRFARKAQIARLNLVLELLNKTVNLG
jgi:hypothetical protein